jgi:TPR repeat protein
MLVQEPLRKAGRAMKQQITTTLITSGVLALALIGTATAGPFEDAQAAYIRDDYAEALRLWGQLVDQGNARAQFNVGKMYYIGQGVQRDYAKADEWFQKAADQGFAYAQFNLGAAYEDGGLGVPRDYALAHMWFNLASSPATDPELREMAVQNRDQVAAKMTPAQIDEAQRMAREWKPRLPPSCPTSMRAGEHCDASDVRRGPMSAD